jgi:hypothetical protein
MAYIAREKDPSFAAAWQEAMEEAIDFVEQIVRERALAGNDELLMFLLRAHPPEIYARPEEIEHTGNVFVVCGSGHTRFIS